MARRIQKPRLRGSRGERAGRPPAPAGPSVTVAAVAAAVGVPPHVVRYYARIGLLKPERDPKNRYKLFNLGHIRRLRFVRQAKSLGFGLGEIRMILRDAERGETPCPRVRDIMRRRVEEHRRELRAQAALQRRMENAMRAWKDLPDGIPTGDSVCYLIESFANRFR